MRAKLSLKGRALQWLAQREQSRVELRRKLLRAVADSRRRVDASGAADSAAAAKGSACAGGDAEVESLLDWLEANGYLSAERFVESRVHARRARFGNLRIEGELAQHGVAMPPAARQALAESEMARASSVLTRRFAASPGDAAQRAKRARFLAARGFSPEVIGRVLRELGRNSAATPVE